jgi:hypothetical protein
LEAWPNVKIICKNIEKVFAHDLGRSIRKDLKRSHSLAARIRKEMTRVRLAMALIRISSSGFRLSRRSQAKAL